jgi:hypothetical protein
MKRVIFGVLLAIAIAAPAGAAGLRMSIGDGVVSIDAEDVTIRQILAEWARLGKTRVINLEGVASGPITIKLERVPENVALDIILRTVPGYMAAPRVEYAANASMYDRILIMSATSPPTPRPATASAAQAPGAFQAPSPNVTQLRPPNVLVPGGMPEPADDSPNDAALAAAAAAGLIPVPAPMGGPVGTTLTNQGVRMPMPDPAEKPAPPASTPANPFNVPAGAARPGLAPPAPPPQTQPDTGLRRPPQADR